MGYFRQSEEMVTFLLSKGAVVDTEDDDERNLLMLASHWGYVDIVDLLLEHMGGKGLNFTDERGGTALHWAARGGHRETGYALLLAGADPNIKDDRGRTPRAYALARDDDGNNLFDVSMGAEIVKVLCNLSQYGATLLQSSPNRHFIRIGNDICV